MSLCKRLLLAASFVKKGSKVCDVGTDHGYLPVFLYKNKLCKSVCATEINEKPFLNAKNTFEAENCGEIPIYLCNGLEKITENEADTVIIAGMGGEVISGIIDRAPFLKSASIDLILQPMTAAGELREYLAQNGFEVKKEKAVVENKKVYSVMLASFSGVRRQLGAAERRIGILKPDCEENLVYINRQKRLCEELLHSIENLEEKEELRNFEFAAKREIEELLKE